MLLEISGEITPERMKGWSQSKNNTQWWIWLLIEARSDAVQSQYCIGTWNVRPLHHAHPSWVAPQGMAKFHWVRQGCGPSVIRLTSFLWLWFQCVCPLATLAIWLGFLLPLTWGISSRLLQQSAAAAPFLGRGVSPHSRPSQPWTWNVDLSSGHRTGKGPFSFQSQRKAMPKNAQTTAQLHSSRTLVK